LWGLIHYKITITIANWQFSCYDFIVDMNNLVQTREHKAEKVAWFLQIVPFICFIGLTGSLSYETAKISSDIDFFIVAKQGRIWTCRFFTVVILKFFGLYRTGDSFKERAGKICPNRYTTDKHLLISPQNRYHAQDYSHMFPLFDNDNIYKKFLQANQWMQGYGYLPPTRALHNIQSAGILSGLRKVSEWILLGKLGEQLEKWAKNFQLKSIMKDDRVNKPDTGLYVDDNELRFHPKPRK